MADAVFAAVAAALVRQSVGKRPAVGCPPPFVNGRYGLRILGVKNGLTVANGGAGKHPRGSP
jgi:hypothetical protein